MSEQPDDVEAVEEEIDLDVRGVSVVWSSENTFPDVSFFNCSPFEAIGLIGQAYRKLKRDYDLDTVEFDEGDE